MRIGAALPNGVTFPIIIPRVEIVRLNNLCFRGPKVKKAGNFIRWSNIWSFFQDTFIRSEFIDEIAMLYIAKDWGEHSVTISCDEIVGWSSTADLALFDLSPHELLAVAETFCPNKRSSALLIKPSRTDICAPLTSKVTLVFRVLNDEASLRVFVHSIYPGVDVGELKGDITKRENRIFFDWDHPGEPI